MPKYDQLSDMLKRRILHGDYALKVLPAERQLALDNGVAHMTARRALQQLHKEGYLVRNPNGRLEVNRAKVADVHPLQIAFLSPSFNSPAFERWRSAIEQAVTHFGAKMRQVPYVHWEDPLVMDGFDGFDGGFILPAAEAIPAHIIDRLIANKRPVVVVSNDLSHAGIPSIRPFPPVFVQRLLDHLESQGHERIACLNVQPHDEVITGRIDQWHTWMRAHYLQGELLDEPVKSFADPFSRGYEIMNRLLAAGNFGATAVFCTTYAATVGAMRAFHEHGIRPGHDVAICAVDGEGQAQFQIPSVTTLEVPDMSPYLQTCLLWMAQGGGAWKGPLLLQPAEASLVVRESTSARFKTNLSSLTNSTTCVEKENQNV
jgi:LacI family transcriptional regulator